MILVRTPKPANTESFMGYVLRVSEANGYDTPWHILKLAGLSQSEMTRADFPVNKFAGVLGVEAETLDRVAYTCQSSSKKQGFKLLGHPLGSSINQPLLRLFRPALCPECVSADGFTDAFFDLKLAVACPVHKRTVISHCAKCGEALRFFRPGLLTCRCGASLADVPPEPVAPALLDLMTIFKAKLHSPSLTTCETERRLPVKSLLALSLRSLITNLPNLLRIEGRNMPKNSLQTADHIGEALSDWPRGLRLFLDKAEDVHREDAMSHHIRLKQVSSSFYRREIRANFTWLHEQLIHYRKQRSGDANQSRQTLHKEAQRRYITNKRQEWPSAGTHSQLPAGGQTLQGRDAAAFLGLPVSVLVQLEISGHFVRRHRTKLKWGYHIADLDVFFAQLLEASPRIRRSAVDTKATVSLYHALGKYRMHDSKQKAGLVLAYLSGSLRSIGRTGESTSDILFRLEDVSALAAISRTDAAGGTLTRSSAAEKLGCDPNAIPSLSSQGYLTASPAREGTRLTRESFEEFARDFVPLGKIARERNTTSYRLKKLCTQANIPVLLVPRPSGPPVSFIQYSHLDALTATANLHPSSEQVRKAKAEMGRSTIATLRDYLNSLQNRQGQLPIRAGKPHKKAIAKACGFNRNVFYVNLEAISLLDAYFAHENTVRSAISALRGYLEGVQDRQEQLPIRAGKPNKKAIAKACGFSRNVFYSNLEAISILDACFAQDHSLTG